MIMTNDKRLLLELTTQWLRQKYPTYRIDGYIFVVDIIFDIGCVQVYFSDNNCTLCFCKGETIFQELVLEYDSPTFFDDIGDACDNYFVGSINCH